MANPVIKSFIFKIGKKPTELRAGDVFSFYRGNDDCWWISISRGNSPIYKYANGVMLRTPDLITSTDNFIEFMGLLAGLMNLDYKCLAKNEFKLCRKNKRP